MLGTFFSALITFFIWIFGGKSYGGLMVYALLGMFPSLLWASFVVMAVSIFGLKLTPAGKCEPISEGRSETRDSNT